MSGSQHNQEAKMNRMVKFSQVTRGDEVMVGSEVWEVIATYMPGDGTVNVWARDQQGNFETLYRRTEEMAVCPIV